MAAKSPQAEKLAAYWGNLAKIYDKNELLAGPTYPAIVEKLQGALNPDDDVLDVGAGTGKLTSQIAPLVRRVVCTDIAPAMIEQAETRLAPFAHVVCQVEDATALTFEDNRFDVVLCCNTLHQMFNPELALREFRRVLRPGGRLLAISLAMGDMSLLARVRTGIAYALRFGIPPARHTFTRDALCQRIAEVGFQVREGVWVTRRPLPTAYVTAVKV